MTDDAWIGWGLAAGATALWLLARHTDILPRPSLSSDVEYTLKDRESRATLAVAHSKADVRAKLLQLLTTGYDDRDPVLDSGRAGSQRHALRRGGGGARVVPSQIIVWEKRLGDVCGLDGLDEYSRYVGDNPAYKGRIYGRKLRCHARRY